MRILPSAAGLTLIGLLLTGCVPDDAGPLPTPVPSSTPVFASDEEALAAAEAAYAEYLAVSDAISADGGANPERLADLVTPEWLDREVSAFQEFASTGLRQTGATTFRNSRIQQSSDDVIIIYACNDSSGTRFVDASGADRTPPQRQTLIGVQVTFEIVDSLELSSSEPWSGDSLC